MFVFLNNLVLELKCYIYATHISIYLPVYKIALIFFRNIAAYKEDEVGDAGVQD